MSRFKTAALLLAAFCAVALPQLVPPAYATVSTETRKAGPYAGNGATTSFSFTFKVFDTSDIVVTVADSSGTETVKTLDSDYSVSLNADQDNNPGGTVTYPISGSALASGNTLTITSGVPQTQSVDLVTGGAFSPGVIEAGLDRGVILAQQLRVDVDRAIKQPSSDSAAIGDLPTKANRASKFLVFDADGDPQASAGSGTDTGLRADLASTTAPNGATLVGVADAGGYYTGTTVESILQEIRSTLASYTAGQGSGLVGFLQAGTGASGRTVQAKLRDVVSVKDFAAVCDDSADDATAIQAGITALQNAGTNAVITFPALCKIGSALTISGATSIWLQGMGWGTGIHNTGTGNAVTIGSASSDQTADVRILDMLIKGNASSAHGVQMLRMHSARIQNCRIRDNGGDGINAQGSYASWFTDNYVNNNTGNGIKLLALAAAGTDFSLVTGNKLLSNGAKGVYVDNAALAGNGGHVEFNDIEGNVIGVQFDVGSASNSDAWSIVGNYFENQTGLNVSVGADGGTGYFRNFRFANNTVNNGTGSAAANAVAFDHILDADISGNALGANDLTMTASSVVGLWYSNHGSGTYPTGFPSGGIPSFSSFKIRDTNGTDVSALSMASGVVKLNYPLGLSDKFYPATASGSVGYQTAAGIYAGSGAPTNSIGANGDFYFRSDGTAAGKTVIYHREGGVWVSAVP